MRTILLFNEPNGQTESNRSNRSSALLSALKFYVLPANQLSDQLRRHHNQNERHRDCGTFLFPTEDNFVHFDADTRDIGLS
jgi:hypothetical protein